MDITHIMSGKKTTKFTKHEREKQNYFFRANQRKANSKVYSLTPGDLTVNGCDRHILAGNRENVLHRLTSKNDISEKLD